EHLSGALTGVTAARSAGMALLVYVLSAVAGVGLGALIRSQLAAVITAVAAHAGGVALVELVRPLGYELARRGGVLWPPAAARAAGGGHRHDLVRVRVPARAAAVGGCGGHGRVRAGARRGRHRRDPRARRQLIVRPIGKSILISLS